MKKIFVLDTNVLLTDPKSLFRFCNHDVVIPISVIEELDTFKKDLSLRGKAAREVSRSLDHLRKLGSFRDGVDLEHAFIQRHTDFHHTTRDDNLYDNKAPSAMPTNPTGKLFIHIATENIPENLPQNCDHYVLAVALALHQKYQRHQKNQVILVTKDTNLRIKAQAYGVDAEDFHAAQVINHEDTYRGNRNYTLNIEEYQQLYEQGSIPCPNNLYTYPHEFVRCIHPENSKQNILCYVQAERLYVLEDTYYSDVWGIQARNDAQKFALKALLDENIRLVTLTGMAGTGKTLLAMAAGLVKTTEHDDYHKLLVSRPIFPMGKDIGYLPGDMEQKLNPWMQPIFDSLDFLLSEGYTRHKSASSHNAQELFHQNMIAVEPLTYIRGRSLAHHYFVVDEAQNLTPHEIKAILTRVGEGTKIVLTGDPQQIDLPYLDSLSNGLVYAIEKFKYHPIAAHITLEKGERSELAKLSAEIL